MSILADKKVVVIPIIGKAGTGPPPTVTVYVREGNSDRCNHLELGSIILIAPANNSCQCYKNRYVYTSHCDDES